MMALASVHLRAKMQMQILAVMPQKTQQQSSCWARSTASHAQLFDEAEPEPPAGREDDDADGGGDGGGGADSGGDGDEPELDASEEQVPVSVRATVLEAAAKLIKRWDDIASAAANVGAMFRGAARAVTFS